MRRPSNFSSPPHPFSVVSASPTMKSYLWVADPRQVTFSCLSKKKSPKRRTPRMAHWSSPPRLWGPALAQRDFLCRGPVAHLPVRDPFGALAQSLTELGCAIRGWKKTMAPLVFSNPRSARRVPQPHRELLSEPVFEPEARSVRPASWRAPGGARNGGNRRSRRALRGVLSFGSFSLHEQRKGTCRGSATHK